MNSQKMFKIVMSNEFKQGIFNAVNMAEREYDFMSDRYSPSFMALLVMYNPNEERLQCFGVREYGSILDDKIVNSAIDKCINNILTQERYSDNILITIIRAKTIHEYKHKHRGYGYPSEQEREMHKMEVENLKLNLYLNIINQQYVL